MNAAEGVDEPPRYGQHYALGRVVVRPILKFPARVHQPGIDRFLDGPAIIAANHISFLDSALLLATLPRQIQFVGKAEYLDDWKTKHLFPALGMIAINRAGGAASNTALDAARRVLEEGGLFGVFPEGTRSRNGLLHKGHTGFARLALQTGAPIVPVGIIDTDIVQPPDALFPKPFMPVTIHYGNPITVDRYVGRTDNRMLLRELTDEVMFEIRALTGQKYVHKYATRTADVAPEPVAPVDLPPANRELVTV
jgi:1-acyl-sn-glycerol-3-phosphate acyltransferase